MEITSFVLGVCAVIVLLMIVGTSVNYMSLKKLKEQLNSLEKYINQVDEARGKQHFEHMDYADQLNNNVVSEMEKLYSYTDSRVDKVINELERIKRTYIKEY